MSEIWKQYKNTDYEVSTLGKIRNKNTLKIRKFHKNPNGYYTVGLHQKTYSVHRIVAETFIINTDNKITVNHIDGDKINNNINNLEWSTMSEQMIHAINTKLLIHNNKPKFKVEKYENDILVKIYNSAKEAADDYGCNINTIRKYCKNGNTNFEGISWKYVKDNEDLDNEIWKDIYIEDEKTDYKVSNMGRIKKDNIIKPNNSSGQSTISLNNKTYLLKNIVATHFIQNPNKLQYIEFIDMNKFNCKAENLKWTDFSSIMTKYNSKNQIIVIQYDMNDNFIKEYPSSTVASKETGIDSSHIIKVCKNKRKQTGGFKWKYKV